MSARHAREAKRDKRIGFIDGRLPQPCQLWKRWRYWGRWREYPPYPKTRGKPGWR